MRFLLLLILLANGALFIYGQGFFWHTARRAGTRPAPPLATQPGSHHPRRPTLIRTRRAKMKPIRKAVFPVAGLGTRFLPATKAMPKEMLPIVDKPLIQYAVEEAVAAGITELIFITGRNKRAIEDHFDRMPELESELIAQEKTSLLNMVHEIIPPHVHCIYTRDRKSVV